MIRCGTGTFLKNKTLSFRFSTNNRMHAPRTFYYHEYKKPRKSICFSGAKSLSIPRYHPHCVFLSGFPGENAHSFILNAYHGSAYLISCSDLMFSRPAPECSPLYVSSMLMLSVGDIGFLSDSAYGVSFTAFFILCIIAQQFYICKHLIFTDFI